MLRMKNVTVMVDDASADDLTAPTLLKIGDTTIYWNSKTGMWMLDIGAGARQKLLSEDNAAFAFIAAIHEQFK